MNSKKAKGPKSKAVFHPVLGIAGKNYNKLLYQETLIFVPSNCIIASMSPRLHDSRPMVLGTS